MIKLRAGAVCSVVIALVVLQTAFVSCNPIQSVTFNDSLRQDTVLFTSNGSYLGPYLVKMGEQTTESRERNRLLTSSQEEQDIIYFSLCEPGACVDGNSYFYHKTKQTTLNLTKVIAERLYGRLVYAKKDTMNFMVDVGGAKPGKGFLRVDQNEMLIIRPISKKSNYGKSAYGVGLEFVREGKVIGSFIQAGEVISVVIRSAESSRIRIVLSALSVALVNRSNEIRLL